MRKTHVRYLAPVIGAVCVCMVVAGCSAGDGPSAQAGQPKSEDEPATTETTDQSGPSTGDSDVSSADSPSSAEALASAELIGVRCDDDGRVEVLAYSADSTESTVAYDDDLPDDATVDCTFRSTFDESFSKVLFSAPGPSSGQSNIWYMDLDSGESVDLTAPRQESGFSADLLNEGSPRFLSEGGSALLSAAVRK